MIIVQICEFASVRPDRTFNVVRGGMERYETDDLPVFLCLWVLLEIPPGTLPCGRHPVQMRMIGPSGFTFRIDTEIVIDDEKQAGAAAVPLCPMLSRHGGYSVLVTCGEQQGRAALDGRPSARRVISLQQLRQAWHRSRGRLGLSLTKLGIIGEEDLTRFLAKQYGIPSIDLAEFEIDPEVIALVPAQVARRHQIISLNRTGDTLIIAMEDPSNIYAIDELKSKTGLNIEVVVTSQESISEALRRYYPVEDPPAPS